MSSDTFIEAVESLRDRERARGHANNVAALTIALDRHRRRETHGTERVGESSRP